MVDLTQMLAGPYCTMLLGDMGADIVKVEPPEGDRTRKLGPYAEDDDLKAFGGYFQSVNRNKRSIVLDLQKANARAAFVRLIRAADVLVENFRPGTMERFGLGFEQLHIENIRLVYAAIRGFGDPRSGVSRFQNWPALDVTAQAFGGFMAITGPRPGTPQKAGPGLGDIFPGTLAALGVLAATIDARSSGVGQFLDVAMYDSVLALCERMVYQYSYGKVVATQEGNGHPFFVPFDVFATSDGFVTLAAANDKHWALLMRKLRRPEWITEERFRTNDSRRQQRQEIIEFIANWMSHRKTKDVLATLGGTVPIGPVQNVTDVIEDAHIQEREMLVSLDQPGSASRRTVVGTPIKFSKSDGSLFERAPLLGEHTDQILIEIGYSPADVIAFKGDALM